jgi:hypothetical protein
VAIGLINTKIEIAEVIEYIDNCWHALKISFANEIGIFCNALVIDAHKAIETFCLDRKLNIVSAYPVASEIAVLRFDEDTPLSLLRAVWPDGLVAEITGGSYGWQRAEDLGRKSDFGCSPRRRPHQRDPEKSDGVTALRFSRIRSVSGH